MTIATAPALASPADVRRLIDGCGVVAFDFETCGPPGKGMEGALNQRLGRVRLLSLSGGQTGLVLDCFEHDPRQFFPALQGKILLAHNAAFDLGWLWNLGMRDLPETVCTMLLSLLLDGPVEQKGYHSLAGCCERWLGKVMNKDLQVSDWSGPLSAEQVEYARQDANVLPRLFQRMGQEIERAGLLAVSDIEMRCLPAWVWMSQSGIAFDREGWLALAEAAMKRKAELIKQLDAKAPPKGEPGLFGPVEWWDWDSPQQCREALEALGYPVTTTRDAQLALISGEFPALLRLFRHQGQMVKMYGPNWLSAAVIECGRLYPGWRQLAQAGGRTTCKRPNCQQIPREAGYRACFRAPAGRALVKCDYRTLQMRVACNQAQDRAMLGVFQAEAAGGPDVHTATARMLLGKEAITKADRQIAKSAGFGLLFGMSAEGLRIYSRTTWGVELSEEEAARLRRTWLEGYPGIARWHSQAQHQTAREIRSRCGRRRLVPAQCPVTWRLNTPVQQDEADIAKTAMALLWERRQQVPSACPVLFNHDEIVVEADESEAETAKAWLCRAMTDAGEPILAPVPCAVEASICKTWGG